MNWKLRETFKGCRKTGASPFNPPPIPFPLLIGLLCICNRDGRPAPRGTLPAGKGGFPAPPRAVGRGGFPALPHPVKMIKTAGKLRGKIKARISTFSNRGNK